MDLAIKIAYQVVIIFLFMATGFTLFKLKKLNSGGISDITTLLLEFVTPCVLISSYQKKIPDYSTKLLSGLGIAALFTLLVHFIAILIATLIFKKEPSGKYKVNLFSAVYSNCGFMAIPILSSVLGTDGVFYGAIYLAFFTILNWTHGIVVYSGSIKAVSMKKLLFNPGVIGTLGALLLFLFKLELPGIVNDAVDSFAALNTPLSMMILGTYLAKVNWKSVFTKPSLYIVAFLRLLLIPFLAIVLIWAINRVYPINLLIARSVLIPSACPAAAASALFAAKYDADATYASELVAVTTLFSIVTLPLIMIISTFFIG